MGYDKCRNLTVDSISVISDAYWNNDGFDISNCKNVRITNCFVNSADDGICLKSGDKDDGLAILPIYRLKDVPEQEAEYPEFSMFGELPAWAFYVRHVSGLSMKNMTVKAVAPDYRPAFVFDDVDGLKLNVLDIHEDDSDKQVIFRNVRNYNKGLSSEIIKIVE